MHYFLLQKSTDADYTWNAPVAPGVALFGERWLQAHITAGDGCSSAIARIDNQSWAFVARVHPGTDRVGRPLHSLAAWHLSQESPLLAGLLGELTQLKDPWAESTPMLRLAGGADDAFLAALEASVLDRGVAAVRSLEAGRAVASLLPGLDYVGVLSYVPQEPPLPGFGLLLSDAEWERDAYLRELVNRGGRRDDQLRQTDIAGLRASGVGRSERQRMLIAALYGQLRPDPDFLERHARWLLANARAVTLKVASVELLLGWGTRDWLEGQDWRLIKERLPELPAELLRKLLGQLPEQIAACAAEESFSCERILSLLSPDDHQAIKHLLGGEPPRSFPLRLGPLLALREIQGALPTTVLFSLARQEPALVEATFSRLSSVGVEPTLAAHLLGQAPLSQCSLSPPPDLPAEILARAASLRPIARLLAPERRWRAWLRAALLHQEQLDIADPEGAWDEASACWTLHAALDREIELPMALSRLGRWRASLGPQHVRDFALRLCPGLAPGWPEQPEQPWGLEPDTLAQLMEAQLFEPDVACAAVASMGAWSLLKLLNLPPALHALADVSQAPPIQPPALLPSPEQLTLLAAASGRPGFWERWPAGAPLPLLSWLLELLPAHPGAAYLSALLEARRGGLLPPELLRTLRPALAPAELLRHAAAYGHRFDLQERKVTIEFLLSDPRLRPDLVRWLQRRLCSVAPSPPPPLKAVEALALLDLLHPVEEVLRGILARAAESEDDLLFQALLERLATTPYPPLPSPNQNLSTDSRVHWLSRIAALPGWEHWKTPS